MITHKELQKLDQKDTYAIICEKLFTLKDNPKYSVMSELAYLLDKTSFINLVKYFGGLSIDIPTPEEFKQTRRLILLYQYFHIENLSWKTALQKAGYSMSDTRQAQKQLIEFSNVLENIKLGRDV